MLLLIQSRRSPFIWNILNIELIDLQHNLKFNFPLENSSEAKKRALSLNEWEQRYSCFNFRYLENLRLWKSLVDGDVFFSGYASNFLSASDAFNGIEHPYRQSLKSFWQNFVSCEFQNLSFILEVIISILSFIFICFPMRLVAVGMTSAPKSFTISTSQKGFNSPRDLYL